MDDWRFSVREDLFQTRRMGATNQYLETKTAMPQRVRSPGQVLMGGRLTAEIISMNSRSRRYVPAGLGLAAHDTQVQFASRFSF